MIFYDPTLFTPYFFLVLGSFLGLLYFIDSYPHNVLILRLQQFSQVFLILFMCELFKAPIFEQIDAQSRFSFQIIVPAILLIASEYTHFSSKTAVSKSTMAGTALAILFVSLVAATHSPNFILSGSLCSLALLLFAATILLSLRYGSEVLGYALAGGVAIPLLTHHFQISIALTPSNAFYPILFFTMYYSVNHPDMDMVKTMIAIIIITAYFSVVQMFCPLAAFPYLNTLWLGTALIEEVSFACKEQPLRLNIQGQSPFLYAIFILIALGLIQLLYGIGLTAIIACFFLIKATSKNSRVSLQQVR